MTKKNLVLFDLDGTLVPHPGNIIPDSALEALRLLREHSYVGIATGRDMDSHYSTGYRDIVQPDCIIHLNGCRVTVGDRVIFEHRLDKAFLRRIQERCDANGISIGFTAGGNDYYTFPELRAQADADLGGIRNRKFMDFNEVYEKDIPVYGLAVNGDLQKAREVLKDIPGIRVVGFNQKHSADLIEDGVSKAAAFEKLRAWYGIPLENTYAFGDSQNDIELLAAAGTGIAMGNGAPQVKEAADYITDDINENGVYNACRHFGLI